MTDKLLCPFCQQELEEDILFGGRVFVSCNNPKCPIMDWGGCSKQIITELIRTRKELERSEICCTEWEKQALDYKAENIALSGELERTRKALDVAKDALGWFDDNSLAARNTLDKITALEQKDVK